MKLTTVKELWNDRWWRWYLLDGHPIAFLPDPPPRPELLTPGADPEKIAAEAT